MNSALVIPGLLGRENALPSQSLFQPQTGHDGKEAANNIPSQTSPKPTMVQPKIDPHTK
jgi:hypothetical protein